MPDQPPVSRRQFLSWGSAALAGTVMNAVRPLAALAAEPAPDFTLPSLPYAVDALEPHVDAATMEIHHGKHHAGYVNSLNAAIAREPALRGKTLEKLLANINALPAAERTVIRNHGGGHYNHSLFWQLMAEKGGGRPTGELLRALESNFGTFDAFVAGFSEAALKQFGSGWAWLVALPDGKLVITTTDNQDNPLMTGIVAVPGVPLLGLDVWEHAYYLKYQNRRADYVKAWWHTVNWDKVAALHQADR